MIDYRLPTTVEVNGIERNIRSDFRAILDIISALNDPELSQNEKAQVCIQIFFEEEIAPDDVKAGLEACFRFIDLGDSVKQNAPNIVDWEQDFRYIIAPINAVAGSDVRALPYLHWWTFLSAYMGIGDCLFAQIVAIRDKKVRGKKLDKADRDFYNRNRDLIDIQKPMTDAEKEILKELDLLSINKSTLFPEIDYVSEYIKSKYDE